jgi:hypothetical protein
LTARKKLRVNKKTTMVNLQAVGIIFFVLMLILSIYMCFVGNLLVNESESLSSHCDNRYHIINAARVVFITSIVFTILIGLMLIGHITEKPLPLIGNLISKFSGKTAFAIMFVFSGVIAGCSMAILILKVSDSCKNNSLRNQSWVALSISLVTFVISVWAFFRMPGVAGKSSGLSYKRIPPEPKDRAAEYKQKKAKIMTQGWFEAADAARSRVAHELPELDVEYADIIHSQKMDTGRRQLEMANLKKQMAAADIEQPPSRRGHLPEAEDAPSRRGYLPEAEDAFGKQPIIAKRKHRVGVN